MKSHEVLRLLVKKYGAKTIAAALGRSPSLIRKWTRPPFPAGTGARNELDRWARLLHVTGYDVRLLDWLCELAGGRFARGHQLPPPARHGLGEIKGALEPMVHQSEERCRMCKQHCRWRSRDGQCGLWLAERN
jgi:hypothetical protein